MAVPLTLRPDHMIDHAGQVSLPGGTHECGETAEHCALREYEEELGASGGELMMLGRLSPIYVYASNFWVAPCVAVAPADRRFTRIQRKWPACWSFRWMIFSIRLAARRHVIERRVHPFPDPPPAMPARSRVGSDGDDSGGIGRRCGRRHG